MAQMFRDAVMTDKGAALLMQAQAGKSQIVFTYMKVGCGCYSEDEKSMEKLRKAENLRSVKNVFAFSDKTLLNAYSLKLTSVISNCNTEGVSIVDAGYYVNEIGLFAKDILNESDTEILYSIAVVDAEQGDYMPPYLGNNSVQIVQEYIINIGTAKEIWVNFSGAYADAESLNQTKEKVDILEKTVNSVVKNISDGVDEKLNKAYQQSTGYTDTKIAELINGAPSTLDTLGEIAQAMQDNENVVDALESAIGSKAPQAELDGHTGNSTIHITASERTKWNNKMEKTGDASNTTAVFTQASSLANISTGEKIGVIMGKVSKAVATLISHVGAKSTASRFAHVKLSDTYSSAVSRGAAANGVGASQKAVADAYTALHNSLGGLTFEQDAEGNWGYKPAGADTVTPFKSGGADFVWSVYGLSGGINLENTGRVTFTVLNYTSAGNVGVYGTTSPTGLSNNGHLYGYFKTDAGAAQVIETPDIESYPYIVLHPVYASGWTNNNTINVCRVAT